MSKGRAFRCLAALAFATLIAVSTAHSQATASLRGTVTDPTGAVIPEASVTIKSLENRLLPQDRHRYQRRVQFS